MTIFRILAVLSLAGVLCAAVNAADECTFDGKENQPVTLRALIKVDSYPEGIGNYIISAFDSDNPKTLLFGLRMNGALLELVTVMRWDGDKPVYRGLSSTVKVPLGEEVYVAGVKNDKYLRVYLNGRNVGQRTVTTQTPKADRLRIGAECRTNNRDRDMQGGIAHAQAFTHAFTDRAIAQDYHSLAPSDLELIAKGEGIYLPVSIPAKPAEFPHAPTRLKLDLRFLESFLPEGRYLDPVGIEVVKWDKQKRMPLPGKVDFRSEYDLVPKHMVIVWQRPEKDAGDYAVQFNGPQRQGRRELAIPFVMGGEPLSMGRTDSFAQGQALAGYPIMLDYDGDGLRDLLVSFVIPRRILFYKNIGSACEPVFRAPEIAFMGKSLLNFDMFQLPDGAIYAYSFKGATLHQWKAADTPEGKTIDHQGTYAIDGLPEEDYNVFDVACVDADGDGVRDLLLGVLQGPWWWEDSNPWNSGQGNPNIGYGRGYDETNKWYGRPPIGSVYLAINEGTDTAPKYAPAQALKVGDQPIEMPTTQMAVTLLDANGDDKLDLLVGCGVDETLIFYNTADEQGELDLAMPVGAYRDSTVSQYSYFDHRFEVVDYDADGKMDVLMNSNPGLTVLCRIDNGLLVESEILAFKGANLWAETLVVPTIVDLNADGLWDVVTGDASGFLSYFRNIGASSQPVFAPREKLRAGGKVFRPTAGYSGSIQGPNESRWGYLAPNVCDYDGDGKLDIVLSDITGYNYWLRNVAAAGGYEFTDPQNLQIDTWPLKVRWRTRPAPWFADGNSQRPSALVTTDEHGYLTMYDRDFIEGPTGLQAGERLTLTDGREIKLDGPSGYNGRSKFCATDYNGDGKTDLLIGQPRRGMTNAGKRYDLCTEGYAYVALLINAGTNAEPVFAPATPLTLADGETLHYGVHSCSPSAMDVDGDGYEEIFIGTERGFVRCYNRSLFEDSSQIISIPGISHK